MRRRFSIGEAVGEPFRLAFKRPLATLAWGLITLIPGLVVTVATFPLIAEAIRSGDLSGAGAAPGMGDFGGVNEFLMFQAWNGLANALSLLAMLVVTCAVIRAVLQGRRPDGAAFLRLSKAELHVAVVGIAVVLGAGIIMAIGILIVGGFGIVGVASGAAWAGWTAVILGFGLALGLLVLWGRLALIAPVSMIVGELAFEEGWAAGKGQTGRLFLLMLALIGVSILIAIALGVLVILGLIVFGPGMGPWSDPAVVDGWILTQLENPGPWLGALAVALLPMAWLQGFGAALWTAPYAVAARDLAPAATPGADPVGPSV